MDIKKKINDAEADTKMEQRILAGNAWHLARYVIEHKSELDIPEGFEHGQFMIWSEKYPRLNDDEKIKFVDQYSELEKAVKNVTARTLVATRIHGHGFMHAAFKTSVGKYLVFLSMVTASFFVLLATDVVYDGLLRDLLGDKLSKAVSPNILTPFCAAGLGTCVYLLRITQEKLITREFDPAHIPSHLIRLGLGVLAGGSIVVFPDLLLLGVTSGSGVPLGVEATQDNKLDVQPITIGQATLAFIMGYAVEIFYSVLDNIGGRIKNNEQITQVHGTAVNH